MMAKAAWKNLISAGGVCWCSPPSRTRRIAGLPPGSHWLTNRESLLQLLPCWLWIWTWHNRPVGDYWLHSPSITATHLPLARLHQSALLSEFVVFPCLFVLASPSCLPFMFSLSFPPHILSIFTNTFQAPYLIFCSFSSFWTFFSSPLAAWAFIPYSISSSSASSFHLSITASAGPIHRKRFYKAKYLLLETVALKRTDLFIHSFIYSLFPKFNRKESRTSYFLWLLQTCTDIQT